MSAFAARVRELPVFTRDQAITVARAPGRMDVMGGNVDYTGGLVFQATIREATWAAAQRRTDGRIVLVNPQLAEHGWEPRVDYSVEDVRDEAGLRAKVNRSSAVRWTAYVAGVFHYLVKRWPAETAGGMTVYLESDVPLNKGVSSSAAVEVATMYAAAGAFGLPLAGMELAEACQWVENVIAESACGIMDQAAVLVGDEGHLMPMVCQPCRVGPLVRLPDALTCWGIDSGVSHAVSGIEYEAARAASFMGYKLICDRAGLPVTLDESGGIPRYMDPRWNGYLSDVPVSLFRERYETMLPDRLSAAEYLAAAGVHADPFTKLREGVVYRVRNCTRYSIEENLRIRAFVELARGASATGSEAAFELMGEMMYQSNGAYTGCGLGCEAIDQLLGYVRAEGAPNGLYGAKVSGGGAGGTVVVLGRKDAEAAFGR
ncbi:MAG: galactokinase, partial [Acidobacteria bacterium]|nr:galactokinase [Acidobacteriota bacterium]